MMKCSPLGRVNSVTFFSNSLRIWAGKIPETNRRIAGRRNFRTRGEYLSPQRIARREIWKSASVRFLSMLVDRIDPEHGAWLLHRFNIQIYHYGFVIAADEDTLQ